MSATGRNLEGHERRADDFYATPAWVTRAILPHLRGGSALDPCCGDGAILDVIGEEWAQTFGLELDAGRASKAAARHAVTCTDALVGGPWPDADACVTNPPYALAMPFIERALVWCACGVSDREVAFLTRLNNAQARVVLQRALAGENYGAIADEFGISRAAVCLIRKGRTYGAVTGAKRVEARRAINSDASKRGVVGEVLIT